MFYFKLNKVLDPLVIKKAYLIDSFNKNVKTTTGLKHSLFFKNRKFFFFDYF